MIVLSREVRNIQNPALGATLLWRFACGYVETHPTREPVPLPLLFLVLPIMLHKETTEFVQGTQNASGLRAFAAKFGEAKTSKQDVLLSIHTRTGELKSLSLQSIRLALSTRLLHAETRAMFIPLSHAEARAGVNTDTRQLMRNAEKLGHWCGQLSLHEIATILKLRF
jgi:hypothetical protein